VNALRGGWGLLWIGRVTPVVRGCGRFSSVGYEVSWWVWCFALRWMWSIGAWGAAQLGEGGIQKRAWCETRGRGGSVGSRGGKPRVCGEYRCVFFLGGVWEWTNGLAEYPMRRTHGFVFCEREGMGDVFEQIVGRGGCEVGG